MVIFDLRDAHGGLPSHERGRIADGVVDGRNPTWHRKLWLDCQAEDRKGVIRLEATLSPVENARTKA